MGCLVTKNAYVLLRTQPHIAISSKVTVNSGAW